ncbi:MAG TPA: DUF6297 family protein, partial [Streptosporangiaceae bacterium]|nr:DUF6297 family protein [Streptosporangiaceae bacterium]
TAFWIYLIAIVLLAWGSPLLLDAVRALRRPPAPTAATPHVLAALPVGLTALALLLLLVLLRDGLWRGPVTLPQVTVDWLLSTPVDRGRLLRPRFRMSALTGLVAGVAVGIVPAAVLTALGLSGHFGVLRLTGVSMASTGLLFGLATGAAGLVERYPAVRHGLRRATPVVFGVAAALAGLAAWAAFGHLPAALDTIVLWSGPWGWAAQGLTALAGGTAPLWPLAAALLGVLALAALAAGHRAAAGVPGPALRARAATIGAMSAALLSMDTRAAATAYSAASQSRRAWLRLGPPRRPELVLLWRDLVALLRAPSRLAGAVVLALVAVGLLALAARGRHVSPLPVACALGLGYLAAAWLCEGARLDAEDTRRSVHLPFRFKSLAWWHAAVPVLVLLAAAGAPVIALTVADGSPRPLLMLAVAVPVLVAGALVNVFRGEFPLDMFAGVDTPLGNTAFFRIIFWSAWGPLASVGVLTFLVASALSSPTSGAVTRTVVLGAGLAAALGAYAARRAARLRTG